MKGFVQDIGVSLSKTDGKPSGIRGGRTGWVQNTTSSNTSMVKRWNRERECRLIYVKDECWRRCNFIHVGSQLIAHVSRSVDIRGGNHGQGPDRRIGEANQRCRQAGGRQSRR